MNLKAVKFLESGSASAELPSSKSVGGRSSVVKNTSTKVGAMTQAQIDGATTPRDHGLRAREFGRRAIVNSRRARFRRWLFSWFVNPSKSDFEETLADLDARQPKLY